MLVVTKSYSDDVVEIMNLNTFERIELEPQEVVPFCRNRDVKGICITENNKLRYAQAYDIVQFPTESEAESYAKSNGLSYQSVLDLGDYYFVLQRNSALTNITVNYYVFNQIGDTYTFVGPKNSYTPYKQSAKIFERNEAIEKAKAMTRNSKTGKYWKYFREVKSC